MTALKKPRSLTAMPMLMALEPRLMFDASVGVAADAVAGHHEPVPVPASARDLPLEFALQPPAATPPATGRNEVVFVDRGVQNYQQLVALLPQGSEVAFLDPARDGLSQMAAYLAQHGPVDVIHVLSHGDVGAVQLGNLWLDSSNLAEHAQDLATIGTRLTPEGDILLYGCKIGDSDTGERFVASLASLTGADVAASTDNTGAASRGGDWILERRQGDVEAGSLAGLVDFQGLLATFTETFGSDPTGGAPVTSFTTTEGGVSYTYTFTSNGDGGDMSYDPGNGVGGSASIFPLSAGVNTGTTERVTITRTDLADFTFNGLFINNSFGSVTVTVGGYLNGSLVGSAQNVTAGSSATLSFSSILVDEVRITSTDLNVNFDNFSGDTNPPLSNPSLSATAANPTFTEGSSAVDLYSSVTADTNDSGQTFAGMTLTVTNVSNGASELLTIGGTDVALNNGNSGTLTGIGSYSVSVAAGTATVTITGMTRTNAQMGTLVDGMTYRNTSDDPGSSSRVVTITGITDSGGSNNTAAPGIASTVAMTPVNDAPTLSATGGTPTYTENGSAVDLFSGVSISTIESGQTIKTLTLTVTNVADGANEILSIDGSNVALTNGNSLTTATNGMTASVSVVAGTATVTVTKVAGITGAAAQTLVDNMSYRNASDAPSTSSRVVTLTSIVDSGGTSNGGVDTTSLSTAATVAVTAVNDAPSITAPGSISVTEDVSSALTGISFSDVDAGSSSVTVTLSVASGTLSATSGGGVTVGGTSTASTLTGSIANINTFIAGSNVTFTTASNATSNVTLTVSIDDGGNTGTDPGTSGTGSSEAASTTVTLSVTAVNDAPVANVPATIAVNEDTTTALTGITFSDVDSGSSSVTVTFSVGSGALAATSGGGVTVGGTSTALTLTGSRNNINTFIAGSNVTFTPASNATSDVILTTTINDNGNTGSGGAQTDTDTTTLQITAVNDAPTITAPGSISVTEDVTTALTGVSFADVDAGSASVTVTLGVGSGALSATSGGGVTVGGTSSAMTLTGSIANINTFIAGSNVVFTTASNASSNVTLSVAIDDGGNTGVDPGTSGTGSSEAASTTVTLSVSAVNDAPVATVPASISVNEDTATAITGISFSDVDAGSSSVTVTLSVGSGTLSATSGGGVTVGGTSTALTLTGSVANINTFIAGSNVTFTTALNATGNVTLTTSINDNGNTGSGGAQTDSDTTTLNVTAVNDAPTITAPGSISVTEDLSSALTGISFSDVDASSGTVTVTLSVASGALSATSAGGVTVGGTSSALTLTGTIANINTFVAGSNVAFTTASNATGNVTLTVAIDDGGNTGIDPGSSGTGSSEAASTTVTLSVTAVNDAPVNSAPGLQHVNQDSTLVFNAGNGNLLSISDVDAGGGTVRVTLTATNGLMTLSGITGLVFSVGSGTGDATMTFDGSIANINNALNGLTFSPTSGYNGSANLQVTTSDLGLTGSGGARTDTDTIAITVDPINPVVTSVSSSSANGGYKVGDTLTLTVSFDQVVNVDTTGGTPTLLLETGSVDRNATYVSGSGTNTLSFSYTVQAGDVSGDLDYQSTGALALNGATIRNVTSNDAILTLPATGGVNSIAGQKAIVVDGVVPTVASVSVPANGTYVAGQNLDFTVNLSEAVTVATAGGTPRIAVTLDTGGTVYASYLSGSGSTALVFRLTVPTGELDSNGITLASSIDANGGTLRDAVGNDAVVALNSVGSTTGVLVDAIDPTVASVSVPASGNYNAGDVLSFTVNTSEAVVVNTAGGTPRLALDIGGATAYASYVSGSGSTALVFQYTVQAGDTDTNGIAMGSLQANGGTLRDAAGNTMSLTLNSVGSTSGVLVDTTAPTPSAIARTAATPTNAASVGYTVTFSEDVSGVDASDFTVVSTGSAAGSVASVTQVDAHTYTVTLNSLSGTGTLRLDLNASGTGIVDTAGNAISGGLTGAVYGVDRDAPTVSNVTVPTNGTYVAGQNLDFTVNFSEAVTVDTSGGTPRIAVTLDTGGTVYASYLSGSGSTALVFRLGVVAGEFDSTGITLAGSIDANGGTLRDAVGNNATATLNSVGSTSGVLIDAVDPTVASVSVPANGNYNAGDVLTFTVNTSEAVTVNTGGGTPRLAMDIGGATAYANYVSGSGSTALVFQYTVQAGDTDTNGIAIGSLQTNGGTLRDAAGNTMSLTLTSVGSTAGVLVDTTAPTPSAIVPTGTTPTNAATLGYTVTFSEDVSGVDASDFTVVSSGSAAASVASVTQVDAHTYTVTLNGVSGTGTLRLDLNASGTGIVDTAGNAISGGLTGTAYSVDRDAPTVGSVSVPADATYVAGQNLDFTVNFSEAVTVDASSGTPRIAVTLDTGGTVYATYLSGSGSTALVFRLAVVTGELDSTGITVGSSIDTNGGSVRDAVGNNAVAALNGVGPTTGVLVDAIAPTVGSIDRNDPSSTSARSVSYTVHFSEAVTGLDTSDFTVLKTGSADGSVDTVTQIDAQTYRVEVGHLSGMGRITLRLNAAGSGIADIAGNTLAAGTDGPPYLVIPVGTTPPIGPFPLPEPTPPVAPAPAPWTPPITFNPTEPVNQVDVPTIRPTTSPSAGQISTGPASVVVPLGPDALAANAVTITPRSEGRAGFIETGATTGQGLQAIPEIGAFPARAGQPLHIALPVSTFTHSEKGEEVTVEVRLANGRPLPAWLKFDPVTGTLSGQPPAGLNQKLDIEVIARDSKGNRASSHIAIEVRAAGRGQSLLLPADAPELAPAELQRLLAEPAGAPAGRPGLAAQFERHGSAARQAERAALMQYLKAASRQG